jgi:hypothetical protein
VSVVGFKPYQIFVLLGMAWPARLLAGEGRWDHENIPRVTIEQWLTAFTEFETGLSYYDLLDGFPDEIVKIDKLLKSRVNDETTNWWRNSEFETDPMWSEIAVIARSLLLSKGISIETPDMADWYRILPEELH